MNERKSQTEPAATDTAPAADNPIRVPKQLRTRLKRVQDYQSQALAKTNALEANLGSVNSGLMGISLQLDHAIRKTLDASPDMIERVQKLLPTIETHLKVARQIDRFTQLELQMSASRKKKARKPTKAR